MFEETEQLIVRVVSATTGQGARVDIQKQSLLKVSSCAYNAASGM